MIRAASWPGPEAERMYARMYGVGVLRVRGLGPGLEFLGFGLVGAGCWGLGVTPARLAAGCGDA